jgi:hypothetical protein
MLLLCILPLIALLLSFAISTSTDVLKSAAKHGSVVGNQRESTTAEEVKLYKGFISTSPKAEIRREFKNNRLAISLFASIRAMKKHFDGL